jgi:hypothetical protein
VDLEALGDLHDAFGAPGDDQVLGEDRALHQPAGGDGDLAGGVDGAVHGPLDAEAAVPGLDLAGEGHILAQQGVDGRGGLGALGVVAEDGHGALLGP